MTYHSVIRNFANIGIQQAERLRQELSLNMPIHLLNFCGSYYKNHEKRDPFVDEIQMLDALVSARASEGSDFAPIEFFTNDTFVARTYADLLKKRKQLHPDSTHPCTLGEAANLATEYIRSIKDASQCSQTVLIPEYVKDSISYPDATCVAAPHSPYHLRLLPITCNDVAEGEALILITPKNQNNQMQFRHQSAIALRNTALMQYIKGIASVGSGGILRQLIDMTDGALIRLSALSPIESSMPATVLSDGFWGCYILRVCSHQVNTVCSLLREQNLHAIPFAQIQQDGKFVFSRDMRKRGNFFTLDAHFLRALCNRSVGTTRLADEAEAAIDKISFGGIGNGKCDYLASNCTLQASEIVKTGRTACAASATITTKSHYKTALWSIIAPIAAMCARGIPCSEQTLAIALELPNDFTDAHTAGACMSTVLGIYRAQTELGMATAGAIRMRSTKDCKNPVVSTWSLAQDVLQTPNVFTKSGSFVYAVSPATDADGLPDFAALRQMLKQICDWKRQGKILSHRILTTEAVTDGIRKMSHSHTCVLSDMTVAAQGDLPLCILIESTEFLPLKCIGKVHPYRRLQISAPEVPHRTELIASECPEVVIVAQITDSNAMALAAYLEDHGAHVSLFTNPQEQSTALARAMMNTQTLILCPYIQLPQTKQIDFALETLRRAGAILLSFSQKALPEGFIYLKKGLDYEILEKICH